MVAGVGGFGDMGVGGQGRLDQCIYTRFFVYNVNKKALANVTIYDTLGSLFDVFFNSKMTSVHFFQNL